MSESRSEDARLRDAFAGPVELASPTPKCPDDETIWRVAHGETAAETRGRVLDHVAGCVACTESWRMARAIADGAGVARKATILPFRRRPVVWVLGAVAAGVALVALLVPTILDPLPSVPGDEFRVPSTVHLDSLIDESVALPRDNVVLRWDGAPEGSLYTVEVADENLEVLVRSRPLEQPEYRVPVDALVDLPSGATVYWRVEAVLPDSTRLSSSVFLIELR